MAISRSRLSRSASELGLPATAEGMVSHLRTWLTEVAAEVDRTRPDKQARLMHASIAPSRLVVFENSGHFPWIEEPELFVQTVKEWLEQAKD